MDQAGELYLGLISGTSADAIDAALVSFDQGVPRLIAGHTHLWPEHLRSPILAIAQGEQTLDLDALGRLDVAIAECFADAAQQVIANAGIASARVRAIGSHGQTMRHRPAGPHPFTMQWGDPSVIAERCRIDVVADFRRADVAAGGQGAPLLPAMHAMLLGCPGHTRAVLNLGGIANVTVLRDDSVLGFDTGPANGLMDAWCLRHRALAYDRNGEFAASGHADENLLQTLLGDPYFALAPPKSTGREHFHLAWLDERLGERNLSPADIQATLLELTVRSVQRAIEDHAPDAEEILVCGGGVHNPVLMARLEVRLAPRTVNSTGARGVDPDYLEAMAFAWLARQRLLGLPGNLPAVTGARGPRVLGAIYPAP